VVENVGRPAWLKQFNSECSHESWDNYIIMFIFLVVEGAVKKILPGPIPSQGADSVISSGT
jgi:hypothetical protein